jgi:CheY-like chemotaxis protein
VVDDNQDAAIGLSLLIRAFGHLSRMTYDGLSAIKIALEYQPNLVLLDIGLPGLNGLEVARQIRQQPVLKNTVLVAVTGWGTGEDKHRSTDAGFDHHLVKPADVDRLREIVTTVAAKFNDD